MKIAISILILMLAITVHGEIKPEEFLECVKGASFNMSATQTVMGEFVLIDKGDTSAMGRYFLLPPQGTFVTSGDTVKFLKMEELKDPWFSTLIDRNPINRDHLYEAEFVGESVSVVIYDYHSLDINFPNVRMGYDKNVCEPFTMELYWPDSVGHAFPGVNVVKYEFEVTDQFTLAPRRREYLNKHGEVFQILIYNTIETVPWTPADNDIIGLLMGKWNYEDKGKK